MLLMAGGVGGEFNIPTPTRVRIGKDKVPVKIVFGGKSKGYSTLFGIGIEMPSNRQLIRMDYHVEHKRRKDKSNEITLIKDGNFHYHVRKWNP